ncbi:hypothetical protein C8K30_106369 [Promicromonospora sp. AC04]|uniref:hypothetical protein n=1 Tax=Promicromonospora sp. AC04 TaxID=2135723 RepID=UPI000D40D589|nr:hypothetical protein [Promicromonospora sp. AC04]PUB26280.1 hypothetical protein C8K30_106369 [Promicromonospora sp. AC04]
MSQEENWVPEVVPLELDDGEAGWEETIMTTEDQQTAIHMVRRSANYAGHVVVHGADTAAAVAGLQAAGDFTVLDGPPAN